MLRTTFAPIARSLRSAFGTDVAECEGWTIPARRLRFGGANFAKDADFLHAGQRDARRLVEQCGMTMESSVLEIGCGTGRLPIGILSTIGDIRSYHGIDVSAAAVDWCKRHIGRHHPSFRFTRIDVRNARYNPSGAVTSQRLPVDDASVDVIYLYSVFSHLLTEDVDAYLREFARVLKPDGMVFLTAFVEDGVPDCEENPAGYGQEWKGALHCVRYDRAFFEKLLDKHGFAVAEMTHGTDTDGQSAYVLAFR